MLLAFLVGKMEIMTMHKDFIGWSLENINAGTVETKYTVEYVNDPKTWEKVLKTNDPWELYSKREYDNISDAITFYMTWFISDKCYFIQLWERVFVNGEMVLEQMIEPKGNVVYNMRMQIDRDMKECLNSTERQSEQLKKENDLLTAFIKRMHAEDMPQEFIQMEGKIK